MKIVTDTREQKPLDFPNSITKTLKVGDYSIEGYEHLISIERKSAADLVQTVTRGNKRFQRELQRGINMDYLGIVVEESFNSLLFDIYEGKAFNKIPGPTVLKTLFTLSRKYNLHVHFCNSREESKNLIMYLFESYYNSKIKQVQGTIKNIEMIDTIQKLKRRLKPR